MELKNLNEASACLLQLIVDNKKLINKNFINVYTEYPDEPYFDNHVFIMYKENTVADLLNLEFELKKNKFFHSLRQIRINDVWYEIAVFTLTNSDYKTIWNLFSGIDSNIGDIIFTNNFHEIKEIIPVGDALEDPILG